MLTIEADFLDIVGSHARRIIHLNRCSFLEVSLYYTDHKLVQVVNDPVHVDTDVFITLPRDQDIEPDTATLKPFACFIKISIERIVMAFQHVCNKSGDFGQSSWD